MHLGLSGAHVKAFNSRGVVAVAGKNREISREDVRRALDAAKGVALPSGREIVHVLPQDFVVDEQDGIGAPIGMTGARLEVNVHVVTGSVATTKNVVASVNRAGVAVLDTVLEQLAASEAVLTPDEKELGVALVDIGVARRISRSSRKGACGTRASCRLEATTSPTISPLASEPRSPTPRRRNEESVVRCRRSSTTRKRSRWPVLGGDSLV